MVDIQIHGPPN